jgi:hypothetical protein
MHSNCNHDLLQVKSDQFSRYYKSRQSNTSGTNRFILKRRLVLKVGKILILLKDIM